jgi:hypothetical protein
MPTANLAAFSKMKYVNSMNFARFRQSFRAKFKSGFICRSDTFDNVQGKFPIGFLIWRLSQTKFPKQITVDVLNENGEKTGKKGFYNEKKYINEWIKFFPTSGKTFGILYAKGIDFQNNQGLWISLETKNSGGS